MRTHSLPFLLCLSFLFISQTCHISAETTFDIENLKEAPALRNELLRAYFKNHRCAPDPVHTNIHVARMTRNEFFTKLVRDRCIDQQIQNMLKETHRSLVDLDKMWNGIQVFWIDSVAQFESDSSSHKQLLIDLERLGKKAGDLKKNLRFLNGIFEEDEATVKKSFNPTATMHKEMAFIDAQMKSVEKSVSNYLFKMNRTVEAEELAGGNMLVRLSRIEDLAKQLAKRK